MFFFRIFRCCLAKITAVRTNLLMLMREIIYSSFGHFALNCMYIS